MGFTHQLRDEVSERILVLPLTHLRHILSSIIQCHKQHGERSSDQCPPFISGFRDEVGVGYLSTYTGSRL